MNPGQNSGASSQHTVDSAAAAIDNLLSVKPEAQETEIANPAPEAEIEAQSEAEADPEQQAAEADIATESEQGDEIESDVTDDEEESAEQQSQPRKFKVKVDGQELEVPEDELLRGYSRTADYTRKTQAHAEKVKQFEAEAQATREKAQRYASGLAEIETLLRSNAPVEPDWATLRQGDPAVFAAKWAEWDQHTKALAQIEAERTAVVEQLQQETAAQMRARLAAEAEQLVKVIPEWSKPEVAKAEKAKLVEHAKSRGFSEEDLAQVADHRIVALLRDAMLYRESQAKAQQKEPLVKQKIEKVKTAVPGPANSQKRVVSETTKRKQRLAKTGRVEDAAAVIATLL